VGLSGVQSAARSLESFIEAQIGSGLALSPLDVDDFGQALDRLRAVLHQFAAGSEPAPDAVLREHADALADRWRSIRLLADTQLVEPEHLSAPTHDDDPLERAALVLLDEIDADLLPVFVEEADELLPQIGEALRQWSLMPQASAAPAALMRHLHTVKGSARMAGAMRLGEAVHEMETRIESSGVRLADSRSLVDELTGRHDQVLALYEAIRDPHLAFDLPVTPTQPSIDLDESSVIELPEALATAESAQSVAPTLIRVRADLLDRLVNEAGEVSIARSRLDNELTGIRQSLGELAENVIRLRSQLREIELAADTQIQARIASEREADTQFDPLEFDRYTRFQELTRLLAESVSDVATVHQNALRGLDDAARDLARQTQVTRELQHDLMRIRMLRFGSVSDRLYRVVRQAAKELDKRVNLELEGADTEIDRSVLERMAGPIEHLLRNAVAHGIESRSQRAALGKAETGEIVLRVTQDSNGVVIGLSDDGAGLDLPRIRARAIERGLIAPEAQLADRELSQLIFMPGFSTATEVTALAGRGVGMDVVRAEVAAMGGRIDLAATPGQGTRFTVHLPVSLAVTQIVLLTVGSTRIAVASGLIEQVMQIKPEALASAYEQHAISWQDEAVPLYFLGSLLELADARPLAQRYSPVVLLRSGHQRIALHVDHVAPSQEVVVKHVGPQLARLTGMAGATVLGNGDIVLILDPVQIAATGRGKPAGQGDTAGFAPLKVDIVPTVMVVDDSVTVRKVTQRLLVREGYQVMLARDGLDALRQVQDSVPDVMLLDIEMPRMDGFELAGRLRNDERLRGIPLVMISSRTADKHRDQAARLGVDAFLGKPFDEIELLETVRELAARGKAST
jgi:chemosensory pili system protein ChpA (sensor histidine kinase/response regulator)